MVVTLSDMVGSCPRKNLLCPKLSCGRLVSLLSHVKIHPALPWCQAVTSDLCYQQWFICVNCRSVGGGRLSKKVLKIHEKSADHRIMVASIPEDPMSKEDDVFQDTFDDPTHEEVNDPKNDHYSSKLNDLVIPLVLPSSSFSPIDLPTISVIMPRTRVVPHIWCLKPYLDLFMQLEPSTTRKSFITY
jgi:hypothetical protein